MPKNVAPPMKCINKTASYNDETCPFDEMFGLKEDPPSQE